MKRPNAEHARLDEEERILSEVEDMLIEHVQWYWRQTRQGPHDDCDCYWMYREGLKRAIERLRQFRRGVYQAY